MKSRVVFISVFCFLICITISALALAGRGQPGEVFGQESCVEEWVETYDGSGSASYDDVADIAVDSAGNVYVFGTMGDGEYSDYLTIKYDSNGDICAGWPQGYDGPVNGKDSASDVAVDSAGNVYVTGASYAGEAATRTDAFTIKYDPDGNRIWEARFHNPDDSVGSYIPNDYARALDLDIYGNVYVSGNTYNTAVGEIDPTRDMFIVKYDGHTGAEQWHVLYNSGVGMNDYLNDMIVDEATGDVYMTGYSTPGQADYLAIKYNTDGIYQWTGSYGNQWIDSDTNEEVRVHDWPYAVTLGPDGDVYVTGRSYGELTAWDSATVKFDSDTGTQLWAIRFDGGIERDDNVQADRSIAVDSGGNVYITGGTQAWTGMGSIAWDYYTAKFIQTTNGGVVADWVRRYNGPADYHDIGIALAIDTCGNVFVTGASSGLTGARDYCTIVYDSDGNLLCTSLYDGAGHSWDIPYAIALDSSGNAYVSGSSYGGGTIEDFCTVKYKGIPDTTPPVISLFGPKCVNIGNGKGKKANKLSLSAVDNGFQIGDITIDDVEIFNNGGKLVKENGVYDIVENDIYVYPSANGWTIRVSATAIDESGNASTEIFDRALIKCKK